MISRKDCFITSFARCMLPKPMFRAMNAIEEVDSPLQMTMGTVLIIEAMVTAARAAVPTFPTIQRSTRLKRA